ncbi:MAG: hypothetical protein ACREDI_13080 [Roseiarcus sp.]
MKALPWARSNSPFRGTRSLIEIMSRVVAITAGSAIVDLALHAANTAAAGGNASLMTIG